MRYVKGSEDYLANLEGLREMEEDIPMTRFERARLRNWVKDGHDIESNPWNDLNSDSSPMNYLKALRIRYGASHGPWDFWEFEVPWKWDISGHVLIENDTLTK